MSLEKAKITVEKAKETPLKVKILKDIELKTKEVKK